MKKNLKKVIGSCPRDFLSKEMNDITKNTIWEKLLLLSAEWIEARKTLLQKAWINVGNRNGEESAQS